MAKELDRVSLTYHDSSNPGRVYVKIDGGRTTLNLTVHEAAEFSERLRDAVRSEGYELVARKRAR